MNGVRRGPELALREDDFSEVRAYIRERGRASLPGLAQNLARRRLNPSQRALIGLALLPFLEGRPQAEPGRPSQSRIIQEASQLVSVGKTYIGEAKRIRDHSPELFARVESGELTVDAAGQRLGRTRRGHKVVELGDDRQETKYLDRARTSLQNWRRRYETQLGARHLHHLLTELQIELRETRRG